MLLIRHDAVEVYCNPVNLRFLTPYIVHWRNLRLHCMTDKDVRSFMPVRFHNKSVRLYHIKAVSSKRSE